MARASRLTRSYLADFCCYNRLMGAGAEGAAAEPFDNSDLLLTEAADWPAEGSEQPGDEQLPNFEEAEDIRPLRVGRPILAGLLILLTVGWLVTAGFVLYRTWEAANLVAIASWIATLCLPLALLALIWLLFGRSSRLETEKFTRAVAQMRGEAQALDQVLGNVAERLAANRTQLGDETARLMKLGEEASDRLGRVTHYLSREAEGLKARSDAVESAAAQARIDVGVLMADLPQAEQSARSFSEALREAGVSAHERALALEAQLSAIAARAQDADAATGGAAERLSAHIARIENSAGVAAQQLDGAAARLDAAVDGALGRTTEAVDATRVALDTQAQAMLAAVDQNRSRLADTGSEAARSLSERIKEMRAALTAQAQGLFGLLDESQARFAAVGEEAAGQVRGRLAEADSALAEQSRALFAHIDESRGRLEAAGNEVGGQLTGQLEGARQLVRTISLGIAAQEEATQRLIGSLNSQIMALDERLTALGQRSEGQSAQMATALASLRDATATLREEVDAGTQEAVAMVSRAQDMAGALDLVGTRLRSELPPVMADVEARAAAMRDTALSAVEPVQALQAAAAEGASRLSEAEQLVARSRESLEALLAGIDGGVVQIDQRLRELTSAATQADDAASLLVRETGPELVEALVRVREAARAAATHAREAISAVIPESAASLSEAAQQALTETIGATVRDQIGELEASSQRAAAAARKASERLTRQLLNLGDSAAALEAKIAEERALRDEQERDAMPRRVALLIESLNSTAIDVTKILSNDVTDTAWQAYLKGDRGVFTRRAVRLLDSGEAREIQRHYDQEPEFRAQVNRYIGDFETMLRRILVDGDGDTLAVTLLSSDMGKLYVALAQAIQHLRV